MTLEAVDGISIRGWFITPKEEQEKKPLFEKDFRPTIVFMQENAGNLGLRIPYFQHVIRNMDVNFLAIAYRGYSYSDSDTPSEEGLKRDADAILKFLRNPEIVDEDIAAAIHPELIWVDGRSLGGAVAAYMASQDPSLFRGVILENTFTSISDMADEIFPFLSPIKQYILNIGWNTIDLVPTLRMPILFITGAKDEIVPHQHTLRLHAVASKAAFKDLLVVADGEHNDTWYAGRKQYLEKVYQFLAKCINEYRFEHQAAEGEAERVQEAKTEDL